MKEKYIMSEEKKTPKLSEEVKKRDADKFCRPLKWLRVFDSNGKEIKIEIEKKP